MKKIASFVVIMVLLFGGVVGASSINGDYKGNPIVKVRVNGSPVVSEIPAQIIDGSTFLPLRAVAQSLNADIQWNQDTYSVDVRSNTVTPANSAPVDLKRVKLYSRIIDQYRKLSVLRDLISSTSDNLRLANDNMLHTGKPDYLNNESSRYFGGTIDAYNNILSPTSSLISEASAQGVDVSDMNQVLTEYSKAIDFYKMAFDDLRKYYTSARDTDYSSFLTHSNDGFNTTTKGALTTITGNTKFYDLIQNY